MDEKLTRKITQDDFVTEKMDVIKNNLLGSYDENNEYHIATPIVEELIALEKLRKSSFGNSVFCVGNLLGYGEIVFEIVYNPKANNNSAQAFLFVLEDVDKINGYLQNTLRTQIAHFTSDVDNFIEESYIKFNVVGALDDEGREKKDLEDISLDDSYILAKKAYSLLLDKLGNEKMLDCYGKYFTARLTALTKLDNPYTNEVLARFNEQYALIQGVFLQSKNFKTLNELLDKCLEEVSGIKEEYSVYESEFNNTVKPDLDKFVGNMSVINEKSENKAIDLLDKSDRAKIQEIISSEGLSEKDLSSEESIREFGEMSAEAPKQTLESLEMEINGLSIKQAEPAKVIQEYETAKDVVEELVEDDVLDEEFESTPEENEEQEEIIQEESLINDLFDSSDSSDAETIDEELTEEEQEVINELFADDNEELQPLFDDTRENKEDVKVDLDKIDSEEMSTISQALDEESYVEEFATDAVDMSYDEMSDAIEQVDESIPEKDEHDHHIDGLNTDYKENASMSIYDRLTKLNKNVKTSNEEIEKTPRTLTGDNKLDRLYNLLDKSIDR